MSGMDWFIGIIGLIVVTLIIDILGGLIQGYYSTGPDTNDSDENRNT